MTESERKQLHLGLEYSVVSQIGTYTYNAAKVIAKYLKPLCSNQCKISDTQEFASLIKDQPPLNDDEEYVSYDVDSLFTNIPVAETIQYIIHQICKEKKISPICSQLIFKRLLLKLIIMFLSIQSSVIKTSRTLRIGWKIILLHH